MLEYPRGIKSSHSIGKIKGISDKNIDYNCSTDYGSSGSPILNLTNYKVIGVHKRKGKFHNQGTLIKYAIQEFQKIHPISSCINKQNQIISTNNILNNNVFNYTPEWLKMRIALNNHLFNNININHHLLENNNNQFGNNNIIEINLFNSEETKDIYILDNSDYIDEFGIKHYHDNLKELNQSNVEVYINDMKTEFKKHYIFSRANFKIKLIIKTKMTNCKNMFCNCSNIKSIDLSSFDSTEVTNMGGMFYGCQNLRSINLSNFNTSKVTDMSDMFSDCSTLSEIDLSSFDTRNVTNMSSMFSSSFTFVNNLINLNLSSFDTRNVTKMDSMFYDCENVTKIILPSTFYTKKVTDMSDMFMECKNLKDLNLSSFDTRNVINMQNMFYRCRNLESLDL